METTNPVEKKKINLLTYLFMSLSIVFFIVCAILTWQLISTHQTLNEQNDTIAKVSQERDQFIAKLETMKKQYDQLSKDNEQLSEMFQAEKAHVEKLLAKVKNSDGSISKYKKQIASLEGRLVEYETQIEELKKQNKELTEENFHIKTALDSTTVENKQLVTTNKGLNETVTKGSTLTTYGISANGIFMRNKTKEITTQRAKKADKIRVCFTIGENAIASAGNKTVYLRIAEPGGNILSQGQGDEFSFDYNGSKLQYSAKEQLTYNNKAVNMCIYWNKTKDMVPGTYTVDIFADNNVIGTSTFIMEK